MSRIIGYLRSGVDGQSIQSQIEQLEAVGATKLFQEQTAGGRRARPQLDKLMSEVRDGDVVVITSLDRIAHSTRHLFEIIESLSAAGASLKVTSIGLDTSTPHGKIICSLLGTIADFERQLVRENQAVGIARAKQEGRYKGRKPTAMAKADEALALNAQGLTRQKIADQLGIGVASVYRILKKHTMQKDSRRKVQKKTAEKPKRVERKPTHKSDAEQLSLF